MQKVDSRQPRNMPKLGFEATAEGGKVLVRSPEGAFTDI